MHGSPAGGLPVKKSLICFKYIDWGNDGKPGVHFFH